MSISAARLVCLDSETAFLGWGTSYFTPPIVQRTGACRLHIVISFRNYIKHKGLKFLHQLNSCQNFNLLKQIRNKQTNTPWVFRREYQRSRKYIAMVTWRHTSPLFVSGKRHLLVAHLYFISQLMQHTLGFQPRIPAMSSFLTLLIGFTCFANGEWSNFLRTKRKNCILVLRAIERRGIGCNL